MTSARIIFASLLTLLASAVAAMAGEFSEFRPLGFSADGKVFAFEEFGVQDGSGFPFANRFFIDTTDDSFLPGSAVRIVIQDETATLADARAKAASKSAALEADYRFGDNPGVIAAFNPLSELDSPPHHLTYIPFSTVPEAFGRHEVRLEEYQVPASSLCASLGDTSTGFRLKVTSPARGIMEPMLLHEDSSVPKSRNCPIGYRIGGVVTYQSSGVWTQAFMILVRSYGFEGENGRWIAITRRFE